ncbi:hypothetical protein, partial [Serratia marcescens]|uniref:hypothetical protein n=1 Tax=Serratia marcescens TaxID=615 RepID=UPI0011B66FF9
MEYEKSASGSVYLIKSDKGYWLPGGFGYTSNKAEAGRFSVADMASLNLDGCTLSLFREDKPLGPGNVLGDEAEQPLAQAHGRHTGNPGHCTPNAKYRAHEG